MRVAYLGNAYRLDSPSGPHAHIGQFITHTVALGHQVRTRPGDQHPDALPLPSTWAGRVRAMRRIDVVYVRMEWRPSPPSRWAVAPYRQLIGTPINVWEFNTVPELGGILGWSKDEVHKAIQGFRHFGRGCDLAVCVSPALADYVQNNLGIDRVITVSNGSDPDLFRPDIQPVRRVQRRPEQLNAVWVGSADTPWHNFDLLRETARILWERGGHHIAFHIIGPGFQLMRDMTPNVHYYGPEAYTALPNWLAAMDVGLCLYRPGPADYSSPLKLFDYMASGLTVVGTIQPQFCDVSEELGQSDLLVPPNDAEALADVLTHLAADRERVQQLGWAGRQRVIDHYNWRRAVQDTFCNIEAVFKEQQ